MENTQQTHAPGFSGCKKKTSQRNHDTFIIPPSLQQYADEPLYILVALWAREKNDWVSRIDISEAFGIADRRASFQVSYISRQNKRITCEVRTVRNGSSPPHHQIRVTGVVMTQDAGRAVPVPRKKIVKPGKVGNATPELRRMFHALMGSQKACRN
ncbi:TPA: CaiF/GrlA family transcriptional regulator [Salmonella enterica subsp. enterica serovar Java]